MTIIDTIEANLNELLKTPNPGSFASSIEKQKHFVATSLERCARCGAHTVHLFPVGLATLCSDCDEHLRRLDYANHGQPFMWFDSMVHAIRSKPESEKAGD